MYTKLLFRLFYTFYVLVIEWRRDALRYARLHMQVLHRYSTWESDYQKAVRRIMRESNDCIIFLMQTEEDLDEAGRRFFIHAQQEYEVSPVYLKKLNRWRVYSLTLYSQM